MSTDFAPSGGYAGFWKRGAAFFIDAVIIMFPQAFFGNIFGAAFMNRMLSADPVQEFIGYALWYKIIAIVVAWIYMAGMESSPFRATIGKLLLGVRVVDKDGGRISFAQATGRFVGRIVSALPLGIGYFLAAWTEKKQALHDMMADCLVVNRDATDAQAHYSCVQDVLRSPVIAAIVIGCAVLLAVSMFNTSRMPAQTVAESKATATNSATELGTIHVIHHTSEPLKIDVASTGSVDLRTSRSLVMQQILTGPATLDALGDLQAGPVRIENSGDLRVYNGTGLYGIGEVFNIQNRN